MSLIKKKNTKYLFVGIIIILIFFLSIVKGNSQEKAIEPIMYDFDNHSIFDIDQENNPNYYNIRNRSEYNGNYPSTYSFEFDKDNDTPENFYHPSQTGVDADVISEHIGHSKVLKLRDNTDSYKCIINQTFTNIKSVGRVNFWWQTTNVDIDYLESLYFDLRDNDNIGIRIGFNYPLGGSIQYDNGTWNPLILNLNNSQWYQIGIAFNCITDTFDFYFQNQTLLTNIAFKNDLTNISMIYFETRKDSSGNIPFYHLIDAIDYSWSYGYFDTRNLIPRKENTDYLEVDKYEFDYDYDDFENNFYYWKQLEKDGSSNDIYIHSNNDISNYISIYTFYGSLYSHGFQYENIDSNAMILNISFNMEILSEVENKDYIHDIYFNVKGQNTSIIKLKIDMNDGYLKIYNQSKDEYENKFIVSGSHEYYINIYINYNDNVLLYWIIDLYNSLTYKYIYNFDIYNGSLYGLDDIFIQTSCFETIGISALEIGYYSVGIYEYGKSFINFNNDYEFGLMYYQLSESWNSDSHNLLTIDSINDYKLYAYTSYTSFLDGYKIRNRDNQTKLEVINLQDSYDNNYPKFIYNNPYLLFQIYGNFTNFYEIEIEGIRLMDDDGNYVYGNYYYNNSDSNNNWFYVIDNKLFYHFNNSEKSYTETMRISFNVYDILLDNESLISYSSYITNNYSGYIYVSSYYNTEIFSISENETIQNTYLNLTDIEHFTLKEILIEIKTNDNSNGLVDGYIQNINVYPEKPLFPEFEPIEYLGSTFIEKMVETIIPMLFFIIPSFIIKTKYGNKAVIPIWILMTFVFLIVNFIPFWICFIIFLSIGLMIMNRDEVME